jgi:hypothetical protein
LSVNFSNFGEWPPSLPNFDAAEEEEVLDHQGKDNGGAYQLSIQKAEPSRIGGITISPANGQRYQATATARRRQQRRRSVQGSP